MNTPAAPDATAPRPLAALADALRYPLGEPALMTSGIVVACRVVASFIPGFSWLLQIFFWLWLYRYALESLAATVDGRDQAPQGWSAVDRGVHNDHVWVQVLLLGLLLVAMHLAPQAQLPWWLALLALLMPAMVLSLLVTQNGFGAVNPLNWLRVAGGLGAAFFGLAAFAWLVLWLQARGSAWLDGAPWQLLAMVVYYLVAQHLTIALFRLMGLVMRARNDAFAEDEAPAVRRAAAQDSHASEMQVEANRIALEPDPARRAAQLALLLPRGAPESAHRDYRRTLRELGDAAALQAHARVRCCELLALGQPQAALALANEALGDAGDFALPDAAATASLMQVAEQRGLLRQAAQFAGNYRRAHPKRYDGYPLAMRAAVILADRLQQPDAALALLRAAQPLAEAGAERDALQEGIGRLQRGQPLGPLTGPA